MEKLTRSYVHGVGAHSLIGETLGERLAQQAATRPEAIALIDRNQGVELTWRGLNARVDDLGAALLRLGLEPGDRIAIWAQNRVEWTLTQLAAARAGLILVNLNPAARAAEVSDHLALVGARALVIQDAFKSSDYIAMCRELMPELDTARPGSLRSTALPELRWVIRLGDEITPGMLNFDGLTDALEANDRKRLRQVAEAVQFDDPVNIQFSNATGGKAAGATLTHHNILNNGYIVGETLRLGEADRVCLPVPLFHCFGMVMGNLACLAHGSTMVYPGEAFDPLDTLEAISEHRCTAVYGVPAMFKAMLEHERFGALNLDTLRTGVMAGAPCPVETMRQVMTDMNMEQVVIAYGMTESSPVSFMSDVDDPVERRVSTVGTIRPHTEVKIVDSEGRIVPPGVSGELCTRGYNVMRGYWNNPELTAQVIDAHGWLHTGDLAQIDEDGYCRIVGGIKDMVIRGGENIYPAEVEEFLLTHPAVSEAVVVGVPDERMGEELCACLRLEPGKTLTPEDIREHCKGRIAHYKIPRHVRVYERFPGSTGRALKFMLRGESLEALGIEDDS
ncbi:fatty-acyl-CoA synthase [Natronocella acetinitrilica]|uniref:Fatty-acyl-CoA synthase n=1 Tax=Natronocella acetinitrilica TaxID=414046 RepID=A0AAE3G6E1_9GAMM|nr:AMP-binding protein [Natronocella acetinitrilica]MCP1674697.1 fatty-acyl-CoA synthase [Natronocella acetinitrilica]